MSALVTHECQDVVCVLLLQHLVVYVGFESVDCVCVFIRQSAAAMDVLDGFGGSWLDLDTLWILWLEWVLLVLVDREYLLVHNWNDNEGRAVVLELWKLML